MPICFDIIPNRGLGGLINCPMYWELKLNDYLKKDGQNCCSLLLGLRNAYHLQDIVKPFPNRKSFAKHKQTGSSQPLFAACPIQSQTTQIA